MTSSTLQHESYNIQLDYISTENFFEVISVSLHLLEREGQQSHLLGMGQKPNDLKFAAWDEKDSLLMSWLWNLMMLEVSNTCIFLNRKGNLGVLEANLF